jgi:predicted nucleotidyltransferase
LETYICFDSRIDLLLLRDSSRIPSFLLSSIIVVDSQIAIVVVVATSGDSFMEPAAGLIEESDEKLLLVE